MTQKYVVERLSSGEMARLAGVTPRTIVNWMVEFGVPRRTVSEALLGKFAGHKSPNLGRKATIETRAKIAKNHHDVRGPNNPMFGKSGSASPVFQRIVSQATRAKLSAAFRGKPRPCMTGEKNPGWKGGRTSLCAKIRMSTQGIEWRGSVYRRDGYACQDCGDKRGGNLNAHHVTHLAALLDLHQIKTVNEAVNCPAIWDVSNGVTLCETCHERRHKKAKSCSIGASTPGI